MGPENSFITFCCKRGCTGIPIGFNQFELFFNRAVWGLLKLLKEHRLTEVEPLTNLLDQVSMLCNRLTVACELAHKIWNQQKLWWKVGMIKRLNSLLLKWEIKCWYCYQYSKSPLQARHSGPYLVMKKVNEVDYIIHTSDRWKSKRLCHINMMKLYTERDDARQTSLPNPVLVEEILAEMIEFSKWDYVMSGSTKLECRILMC